MLVKNALSMSDATTSITEYNILKNIHQGRAVMLWEFSDLLSRYYERECRLLRKELQDIERRMKYPETNVTELAELTKKPEYTVKEVLSMLKVYVDEEGHI